MNDKQQVSQFPALLKQSMGEISRALPKHLSADRMTRVALTAFRTTPNMDKCDPLSLIAGVIMLAQLGLEPGVGGQAYLIPYWSTKRNRYEVNAIPGWQGLIDLVARAGRASAWTGAVFEGDEFDYALGDSPFIRHKPTGDADPEKLTHVYAVGRVGDAKWPIIEVWTMAKVRAHFKRVVRPKEQAGHYANKNWEMYGRKVALLQVMKYLPKSVELITAMQLDYEQGNQQLDPFSVIEGEWAPAPREEEPEDADAAAPRGAHEDRDAANERLRTAAEGGESKPGEGAKPAADAAKPTTGTGRRRTSRPVE